VIRPSAGLVANAADPVSVLVDRAVDDVGDDAPVGEQRIDEPRWSRGSVPLIETSGLSTCMPGEMTLPLMIDGAAEVHEMPVREV
jgi:hypothetical protein